MPERFQKNPDELCGNKDQFLQFFESKEFSEMLNLDFENPKTPKGCFSTLESCEYFDQKS